MRIPCYVLLFTVSHVIWNLLGAFGVMFFVEYGKVFSLTDDRPSSQHEDRLIRKKPYYYPAAKSITGS